MSATTNHYVHRWSGDISMQVAAVDASTGPEINIESILALEKRIKGGTGDTIQLKRARNSLLNISTRVPPEILGDIFRWNVIPVGDFGGLVKGSYNFVLVCRHWFEVASNTPELWSFWGNTLEQWLERYQHHGTAPIEARLREYAGMGRGHQVVLDVPLRDALRDRVERDSIRAFHFSIPDTDLLRSIFPVLIPSGQGIQRSSIESLVLEDLGMDVSDFFARRHFPKLRRLSLFGRTGVSTWVHLQSHMTALTTLSLVIGDPPTSPTPTVSQLLSIFASNPRLQRLSLSMPPFFKEYGDLSIPPIQSPHLKCLQFSGDFEPLLQLLHRISHQEPMDKKRFRFTGCGVATASGIASPTLSPGYRPPFLMFEVSLAEDTDRESFDRLCVDFVAHIPREHVVCFEVCIGQDPVKEIIPTMLSIRELTLMNMTFPEGFLQPAPDGPFAGTKLLPSLRYLHLDNGVDLDWSSLASYLAYQTSGGQVISLEVTGVSHHICPHVVESIRSVVEELILDIYLEEVYPLRVCR